MENATKSAATGASPATGERALTRQQRDQLIEEAAKGMMPEHQQKVLDPLKPWWPQIKRKLKQGYSVRQVHDMVSSPKIGLSVSTRSLQRYVAAHNAPGPANARAKGAVTGSAK